MNKTQCIVKKCRKCGDKLAVGDNWYPSDANKRTSYICIRCKNAESREYYYNYGKEKRRLARQQRLRDTYVYILYAPEVNHYKIGQSDDPKLRAKNLEIASPVVLELLWWGLCPGGTEKQMHVHFAVKQVRGEWFENLTNEDIKFIKQQVKEDGQKSKVG